MKTREFFEMVEAHCAGKRCSNASDWYIVTRAAMEALKETSILNTIKQMGWDLSITNEELFLMLEARADSQNSYGLIIPEGYRKPSVRLACFQIKRTRKNGCLRFARLEMPDWDIDMDGDFEETVCAWLTEGIQESLAAATPVYIKALQGAAGLERANLTLSEFRHLGALVSPLFHSFPLPLLTSDGGVMYVAPSDYTVNKIIERLSEQFRQSVGSAQMQPFQEALQEFRASVRRDRKPIAYLARPYFARQLAEMVPMIPKLADSDQPLAELFSMDFLSRLLWDDFMSTKEGQVIIYPISDFPPISEGRYARPCNGAIEQGEFHSAEELESVLSMGCLVIPNR